MSPLTCPSDNCPFCRGEACNACVREPLPHGAQRVCRHDAVERHSAVPVFNGARDRVPTVELAVPIVVERIEISLEDAEQAAAFLERVAELIRTRRRVTLIVE